MSKKDNVKKVVIGTGIAAAAGYVAGILTAPKSGKDTREDIKRTTKEELDSADKKLKALHSEINELIANFKEDKFGLTGRNAKKFEEALDKAKEAREKLSTVMDAVKKGGSKEDKDLDQAIKEAEKAIEHAKVFLLKK